MRGHIFQIVFFFSASRQADKEKSDNNKYFWEYTYDFN